MSLLNNDCLPENLRDLSSGWEHHLLSRVFYSDFKCSFKKKMFMWPFKIIIIKKNYQESISNSLSLNKTQYLSVSSYLVCSIIIKLMTEPSEEMSLSAPLEWNSWKMEGMSVLHCFYQVSWKIFAHLELKHIRTHELPSHLCRNCIYMWSKN